MSKKTADLVRTLSAASRRDRSNPEDFDWPESLPDDAWCFSPELLSLAGTEAYDQLDDARRRRLAFFEAVNFFSLNVHGERSLIEGLAARLYRDDSTPYLHHFLDEENKHMVYFGTFCNRYAGKIYPERKLAFPREYAPGEEDFLFFAKVLVFEEIVDVYNRRMAEDARLHPLLREINRMHHRDESRHLAFGRQVVAELFEKQSPGWSPPVLEGVRAYVAGYLRTTWTEYYNPAVYADAGLPDPYALQRATFDAPSGRRHRQEVAGPCVKWLRKAGILAGEPEP